MTVTASKETSARRSPAARLRDVTAEIERELRQETWPEGLMELRPGAPGDGEIRILFAVEPPGTALLIAVLEGRQAVRGVRCVSRGVLPH
jgi:hypothetical protein